MKDRPPDTPPDTTAPSGVFVSIQIAAEPATVWKFLSEGGRFASWIGAHGGQGPLEGTKIEPRVGGELRVCYPGGAAAAGQIITFEPPRRVVFTWGYTQESHGLPPGSSRVEVTLTPVPEGTLVQLSHTGLPNEEMRKGHLGGWKHYVSMLAREASALQHGEAAQRALDAYFKAWAEADESARLRLLTAACEPGAQVRTSFACTDGLPKLSDHIAGSLRHMPGMTLAPDGPVQTLHGHARVRWSVKAPDGRAVMKGEVFAALSLAGRLERVVSFSDPPS